MNVEQILNIPDPRFRDFVALKVGGKDQYSYLGYAALRSQISPTDRRKVEAALEIHADRAKVYRWMLRGLPADYAIRKVKTDLEVSANAQYAQEEREFYQDFDNWDIAKDMILDGEEDELQAMIHPSKQPDTFAVGDIVLIRQHANKVLITRNGEILSEKEINNDIHFDNFLKKFRHNHSYRDSILKGQQ